MQNTSGTQSQNQPNRDDQVKGGQPSHQGSSNDSTKSSTNVNESEQRNQNRPSNEAPVKGGQPPRQGGNK
jgi:hypothetical protein